jgi:RNA polymerase sigma-70 factor, ECF subfamily
MAAIDDGDTGVPPDDVVLARLRDGDEATFALMVDAWSPGLLRAARAYVVTAESAEDVVQDTWLAVIRGIGGFEGRSSLRTWVYRILVNAAKARGVRDRRTVPFADTGAAVDPARFQGPGTLAVH